MVFFRTCCLYFICLSLSTTYAEDKYFILRNPHSGLVWDLADNWLVLANSTGVDTQLWKLEPARKGLYYVVNKKEGRVLDYDTTSGVSQHCRLPLTHKVGVNRYSGCPIYNVNPEGRVTNIGYCQQWYVQYGGVIVNACDNYGVTILDEVYKVGTYLRTSHAIGAPNQKFEFVYV